MPTLPTYVQLAQGIKETYLERFPNGDIPPYVMIERGGKIEYIVLTFCKSFYHAIPMLRTCHAMIPGYDALVVVHETRQKSVSAESGKTLDDFRAEYEPGEFDRLTRAGLAGEHGIIDNVMICRITPDGRQSATMLPYLYSGKDTPFHWLASQFLSTDDPDSKFAVTGRVTEAIAYACSGPKMAEMVASEAGEGIVPPEAWTEGEPARRDQIQVAMTLHFLETQDCMVLSSAEAYGSLLP